MDRGGIRVCNHIHKMRFALPRLQGFLVGFMVGFIVFAVDAKV